MIQTITKTQNIYLSLPETSLEKATSSVEIRCAFTSVLQKLLERQGNNIITTPLNPSNSAEFLSTFKTHPSVYQASVSRQLAVDLPPNAEETLLKDEPKDWFIKTADYDDECDRVLQHRDGELTQLFADVNRYHQILQQHCDRVILLRSPSYTGYDRQLTSAMQCLGYSPQQFQFIIVQPLKLYAFHKPSQQVQPIPDLLPQELLKAMSLNELKWHSFHTPLTSVAPLNISSIGQSKNNNSYDRISQFGLNCSRLLQETQAENTIFKVSLEDITWKYSLATQIVDLLTATPQIIQQSADELAPHLICKHIEKICESGDRWLNVFDSTPDNCLLLATTHKILKDLWVNILGLQ